MTREYFIFRATVRGSIQTILVDRESFKDEGLEPQDYFVGNPSDVKQVGIVQMMGDTDYLDDIYKNE